MQVYGPSHLHGVHGVNAPHGPAAAGAVEPSSGLTAPRDELQISDVGRFVDQAHGLPDIRADRVQELRAALASGTYDIESKLDLTVSRLLDEIG
jgi:anti-sigma28 factor (negative regulator of flagellin synthesis)